MVVEYKKESRILQIKAVEKIIVSDKKNTAS